MAERSIGSLFVNIVPGTKEFNTMLTKDMNNAAVNIGNNTGKTMGSNIVNKLKSFTGPMALAVGAGIGVALVSGIKRTIDSASDLEESLSKTSAVFGDSAMSGLEAWSKGASTAFGQSQQQALEAASSYGNLLQAFGLTRDQALGMSKDMTVLASDLASFNNTSVDDALLAIRSGLSGETEPLKRFGVALSEVRLKEMAEEMGLIEKGAKGPLSVAAKSQAAYALILKDTSLAQGDYARTADGLANSQRTLEAEIANLKTEVGTAFMPILKDLILAFKDALPEIKERFLPAIKELAESFKTDILPAIISILPIAISLFALFAENIEIILGVVTALTSLSLIVRAMTILQAAFNLIMAANPYVLAAIAIAALIAGLVYFFTQTEVGKQMITDFGNLLVATFEGIVNFITTSFTNIGVFIKDLITGISTTFTTVFNNIVNFFKSVINTIIGFWEGFINFFINGINMIVKGINSIKIKVPDWLQGLTGGATSIGFNIPSLANVSLPRLAEGGVVMPRNGGVLAQIAEAGQPEAVIPLNKLDEILGGSGKGDTYIYNAAENRSLSTEEEFIKSAKRTRLQVVR
jgi:phage-related protein